MNNIREALFTLGACHDAQDWVKEEVLRGSTDLEIWRAIPTPSWAVFPFRDNEDGKRLFTVVMECLGSLAPMVRPGLEELDLWRRFDEIRGDCTTHFAKVGEGSYLIAQVRLSEAYGEELAGMTYRILDTSATSYRTARYRTVQLLHEALLYSPHVAMEQADLAVAYLPEEEAPDLVGIVQKHFTEEDFKAALLRRAAGALS